MCGSEKYDQVARILRTNDRSFDLRHFDSAIKSSANLFITADRNFNTYELPLYELTRIQVFYTNDSTFDANLIDFINSFS